MKLAILSESPADEAALQVLVAGVLHAPFTTVQAALRARGWPSVEQVLPAIVRHLHFNTDTDGLVVVCDTDDSPVHTPDHEAPGYFHPQCRVCRLRGAFRRTTRNLPPARRLPWAAGGLWPVLWFALSSASPVARCAHDRPPPALPLRSAHGLPRRPP